MSNYRKAFQSDGLKACTIGPVATARGSVTRRSKTDFNGLTAPRDIHSDTAVIVNESDARGFARHSQLSPTVQPAAGGPRSLRACPSDNTAIRVRAGLTTIAPGRNRGIRIRAPSLRRTLADRNSPLALLAFSNIPCGPTGPLGRNRSADCLRSRR